ncbi:MAG TPA: hypothetical protein VMH35_25365 [Streptosporangiaceae bacterium]|nr:hypothetical protein [Streptosporangiaceae bacterium]
MNGGVADDALMGFLAALTLLLVVSLLTVIRQPPWLPADDTPGQPAGPEPTDRWAAYPEPADRGPAHPEPAHPRAAHPGAAHPGTAHGRHSAGSPAEPEPPPLPVRQPGQSGWPRTPPGGPAGATGGPPPVSGGPPWGPASRPPGVAP